MSRLVTVYGGSGFVGRYVVQRLAHAGWRVRVAVRRPNEALFVRTYGTVGQVEPVACNIRDDASVGLVMQGADAVVNCVGILNELGNNKFDAVHHEGAARIAQLAATQGVSRLVQVSALSSDSNSSSNYARSKALGEQAVLAAFPDAVILRPSVVFGPDDQFFNRFANMTKYGWVLPLVGANTKFQPVYVDDVAAAAEMAVSGTAAPGIYELGGPETDSLHALVQKTLQTIHRRRLVVKLPFWVGASVGWYLDLVQKMALRLFVNTILTRDQVRLLRHDNVVHEGARTLQDLGISPTPFESVVPEYLQRFCPDGQFDAIRASARNLRDT